MSKKIEESIKATKPQTMSIRVSEYENLRSERALWEKNARYWDSEFQKLSLEFMQLESLEKLVPEVRKFIDQLMNHKYTTLIELQEHIDDSVEVIKAILPEQEKQAEKKVPGLVFNTPQPAAQMHEDWLDAIHAPQLRVGNNVWDRLVGVEPLRTDRFFAEPGQAPRPLDDPF